MDQNMIGKSVITVEQINRILTNYRIGKKPLAKLLGWGETTILRYVEGDIPTNEYSDKLMMILDNPGFFYEILLRNQGNITQVAFNKCRKAVLRQMLQSKICIVAQYIINRRNGDISLAELQNYIYYSQCFSLALYSQPLVEDDYLVNDLGLPFERITKDYSLRKISVMEIGEEALGKRERDLIDEVVKAFDWYGPKMFENLIGYEKGVLKISRNKLNQKIIAKENIKYQFSDILALYNIREASDIHKYPDRRFIELKNLY